MRIFKHLIIAPKQAQQGFTLVELVTIIILLGIVSIAAVPRFTGTDGFTEYALQKRLISALRNVQLKSMYDTRSDYCYKMIINTSSGNTGFGPTTSSYLAGQQVSSCSNAVDASSNDFLRASSAEIEGEGITFTALDGSTPISFIQFSNLGYAQTSAGSCAGGCTFSFTGESSADICIASEGYIYAC